MDYHEPEWARVRRRRTAPSRERTHIPSPELEAFLLILQVSGCANLWTVTLLSFTNWSWERTLVLFLIAAAASCHTMILAAEPVPVPIRTTVPASSPSFDRVPNRASRARCPVCAESIPIYNRVSCRSCEVHYHVDCARYSRECAMYGCETSLPNL